MNKTVLAQIDTIAGNIEYNSAKIKDYIVRAKKEKADLIIFPRYALTGYPFGDILSRHKSITELQHVKLNEIAKIADNITVILNYADIIENLQTDKTAIIQNGKISYESIFELNKQKYSVIAFPLININVSFKSNDSVLYTQMLKRVQRDIKLQNIETIIHLDSAPSKLGFWEKRNTYISEITEKLKVNYIYVNKAGYADNYCFEGGSTIYDKEGCLSLRAKIFEEDFAIFENLKGQISAIPEFMDKQTDIFNFEQNYKNDIERTFRISVYAIKQYFKKNGFKKAVLGLSGGLDSSVCAVLLTEALSKENVFGISMPSKITSKESKNDAKILAENLGINFIEIPLTAMVEEIKSNLETAFSDCNLERNINSTTIENLQARVRATILWSFSNEYEKMLPIATSDKSEAYIGYATINGDMSGGFAPIADITKTKLFILADYLNNKLGNVIPKSILEKPPGAELKINPKTNKPVAAEEDNMPYLFLDEIIWLLENKNWGINQLLEHKFLYETKNKISKDQKEEWISKFYKKSKNAVYKWHIIPPTVIIDNHSIIGTEYHHPIISKVY